MLRLSAAGTLSPAERAMLRDTQSNSRPHPPHTVLSADRTAHAPLILLGGWACTKRLLRDGRRQIVQFILPGDVVGSVLEPDRPSANAAVSLTAVTVADGRPLSRAVWEPEAAGLRDALRQMERAAEARLTDHIVRLGRQTAYERVVHLMLEFHHRLSGIGRVRDGSFSLPLTQEVLADALGLSVVHINRTLQQVRRDRLFEMRSGQVTLRQIDLMQAIADWARPEV